MMFQLVKKVLVFVQAIMSGSLGQNFCSLHHIWPLRKVLMNYISYCGLIILHLSSESLHTLRRTFIKLTNGFWYLMITYCWQNRFLYETFTTRNLTAFSSLLTLMTYSRANFKNGTISKLMFYQTQHVCTFPQVY